ncbi:hypothetical protein HOY80DRAFT_986490 [Tuber brumale]|nr:hypothetical protein HOY80DRAFT_986490 [Tuber brumale]
MRKSRIVQRKPKLRLTASRPLHGEEGKVSLENNPMHAQNHNPSVAGPKAQALIAARQESKNARIDTRLSKDRKQLLKDCDGPEPDIQIDVHAILQLCF